MSRHDVNYEVLGRRSSTASSGSAADLDDDGDVDVDDFVIFQPQLTGPLAEVAAAAMAMEQMAAPMALLAAPQAEAVVVEPWTDEESSATLRVKGLSGGPALTVLQPHTTYQLHYRAGVEEVNGFMVSVYADGDAQEISGVSASTGEWSDADVFEFIDMATAGGDPTYDGNGCMLRQIVHGFWFTGSGESVEELADRRGQLFQFTTGDAGTIHFELFMDWIDVASREGVWMRTDLTVEVVDPTASASSASEATVVDSSFKPHMGFDAQFGSALVAALLATGGTEPEFALADLDGDGDADLADFAMFQAAFGTTGGTRYTWNTENRLAGVEPLAPNTDDKKLQFAYDHMGRRVLKRVWTYTAGSWGNPTAETKYVYDGWRVIMELDGLNSDAVTRKFTWGLDLSGSVEGAGGIGGLLAAEDTAGTTVATDDRSFIYFYELNGNVGQSVETTTGTDYGTIAAKYEYDPYGKRINTASPGEYDQPYRFSTKPVDEETGLGYWIKRYYSYDLGRWVSRDPIGERGGVNLYAYVGNEPIYAFDAYGDKLVPVKVKWTKRRLLDVPEGVWQQKGGVESFTVVPTCEVVEERSSDSARKGGKPKCCWRINVSQNVKELKAWYKDGYAGAKVHEQKHVDHFERAWGAITRKWNAFESNSGRQCWSEECAKQTCGLLNAYAEWQGWLRQHDDKRFDYETYGRKQSQDDPTVKAAWERIAKEIEKNIEDAEEKYDKLLADRSNTCR